MSCDEEELYEVGEWFPLTPESGHLHVVDRIHPTRQSRSQEAWNKMGMSNFFDITVFLTELSQKYFVKVRLTDSINDGMCR